MQDIDILVNSKPVRQIAHEGKLYIVAKPGTQYEIRVKNNSTSRIMAVASVDGLSALDGKPADRNGPGYVLQGLNSYTIKGWRISHDEVSAFEFSKKSDSYAAKSEDGDPRNVGVIGVTIHAEKIKQPKIKIQKEYIPYYVDRPVYPYYRRQYIHPYDTQPYWCSGTGYTSGNTMQLSAQNQGSMMNSGDTGMLRSVNFSQTLESSSSPEFDMGTKFSDNSLTDKVTSTEFKSSHILKEVSIYYASEKQLRALGVPVDKETKVAFPQSFPGGFCKPPKK